MGSADLIGGLCRRGVLIKGRGPRGSTELTEQSHVLDIPLELGLLSKCTDSSKFL